MSTIGKCNSKMMSCPEQEASLESAVDSHSSFADEWPLTTFLTLGTYAFARLAWESLQAMRTARFRNDSTGFVSWFQRIRTDIIYGRGEYSWEVESPESRKIKSDVRDYLSGARMEQTSHSLAFWNSYKGRKRVLPAQVEVGMYLLWSVMESADVGEIYKTALVESLLKDEESFEIEIPEVLKMHALSVALRSGDHEISSNSKIRLLRIARAKGLLGPAYRRGTDTVQIYMQGEIFDTGQFAEMTTGYDTAFADLDHNMRKLAGRLVKMPMGRLGDKSLNDVIVDRWLKLEPEERLEHLGKSPKSGYYSEDFYLFFEIPQSFLEDDIVVDREKRLFFNEFLIFQRDFKVWLKFALYHDQSMDNLAVFCGMDRDYFEESVISGDRELATMLSELSSPADVYEFRSILIIMSYPTLRSMYEEIEPMEAYRDAMQFFEAWPNPGLIPTPQFVVDLSIPLRNGLPLNEVIELYRRSENVMKISDYPGFRPNGLLKK